MSENKKRWIGLLALVPGIGMMFMDQTILPVALPTIQRQFGSSSAEVQWAVNSYILAIAVFVLAAGKLGDKIGHRRTFNFGMALFGVASGFCALSMNMAFLIAMRSVQGIGAALMFPAQTALIATMFPPAKRGKASGIMVSISTLFLILAPPLGGYLTESVSWNWIFWINLPIAGIGLVVSLLFLPPPKPGEAKIDGLGFLYFAFFCTSATLLLMQSREWGLTSPGILTCIALGILAFLLLLFREKKAKRPFLDLSLFKEPIFTAVNISVSATQFILMVTVFRAMYFQYALGYSPFETGMITFITCFPVMLISPIGGILSDRFGPRIPLSIGFALLIFSFIWPGIFSMPGLASLLFASIAFGMGIPLIFTPSYSAGMSTVPLSKIGIGSGMIATCRNLAAVAGVAIIGFITDAVQAETFVRLAKWTDVSKETLLQISNGTLAIKQAAPSPQIASVLKAALQQGRIAGFSKVHYFLAFFLGVAWIATLFLHRHKSAHKLPATPSEGWD